MLKGDRPHQLQLIKGKAYVYRNDRESFIVLRFPEYTSALCDDIRRDCGLRGTPNIREYIELVPVFDGDLYVYKYIEGEPISSLFNNKNKTFMSIHRIKTIISQISKALMALHQAGTLGTCFNTSNIILGPKDLVTLFEYGFYPATNPSSQFPMPQENQYSFAADMWLLGIVFWSILHMKPFMGSYEISEKVLKVYRPEVIELVQQMINPQVKDRITFSQFYRTELFLDEQSAKFYDNSGVEQNIRGQISSSSIMMSSVDIQKALHEEEQQVLKPQSSGLFVIQEQSKDYFSNPQQSDHISPASVYLNQTVPSYSMDQPSQMKDKQSQLIQPIPEETKEQVDNQDPYLHQNYQQPQRSSNLKPPNIILFSDLEERVQGDSPARQSQQSNSYISTNGSNLKPPALNIVSQEQSSKAMRLIKICRFRLALLSHMGQLIVSSQRDSDFEKYCSYVTLKILKSEYLKFQTYFNLPENQQLKNLQEYKQFEADVIGRNYEGEFHQRYLQVRDGQRLKTQESPNSRKLDSPQKSQIYDVSPFLNEGRLLYIKFKSTFSQLFNKYQESVQGKNTTSLLTLLKLTEKIVDQFDFPQFEELIQPYGDFETFIENFSNKTFSQIAFFFTQIHKDAYPI